MLEVRELGLPGVFEISPRLHEDARGFFSETYNARSMAEHGIEHTFVQDNHSRSGEAGVLRGLHYQLHPHAQAKLVRVVKGSVFDVAVDIRRGSPTFCKWVGIQLSAKKWNQFLVPVGFAHGFLTLEPDTEVIYKVTDYYAPEHDRNLRFDDPQIGIDWPLGNVRPILSDRDRNAPLLGEAETFLYP
ncbi:dTDP-4-dehydrorhamnose 3,5-epimerase [Afifella sp. IM 167]|uniref:dTDP-4-dehydrorhamnose 3,5-epimerase n=1 Tax=Afifella sp. IM 167 TaxID=2033586 RepID=UPI001CCB177A|nr:dTDP-4-dehydrorhamnose 3,5-epimerase [Afifella sp. IM 167]